MSSHKGVDEGGLASGRRVLIIDDEERLATTLRLALGDRHDVDLALTGEDALQQLRGADAYDLVLCDLAMPGISGMDVYETIERERPELARAFVITTGGAYTRRAKEFMATHGLPHLEKPFGLAEVERLLDRTG